MSSAIVFQDGIMHIAAAQTRGERDVGGTVIGAVEHDDLVVAQELHVHGGDADACLQQLPVALAAEG